MESAIEDARSGFEGHQAWWFLPLYGALTDPEKTYTGIWVERFFGRCLELPGVPNASQYAADMEELAQLRARLAPRDEFYRRCEELWYRGPYGAAEAVIRLNAAVSKLFALVAMELHPSGSRPFVVYSGVVVHLMAAVGYTPEVFRLAAEEFRAAWRIRQEGIPPNQVLHLTAAAYYAFRSVPVAGGGPGQVSRVVR